MTVWPSTSHCGSEQPRQSNANILEYGMQAVPEQLEGIGTAQKLVMLSFAGQIRTAGCYCCCSRPGLQKILSVVRDMNPAKAPDLQ